MIAVLSFLIACIVLGIIWVRTLRRNYFTAGLTMVLAILVISFLYSVFVWFTT